VYYEVIIDVLYCVDVMMCFVVCVVKCHHVITNTARKPVCC